VCSAWVQVTAIPQGSCAHASADALNLWSVQNKQDYAQLYGYEFHLSAHDVALAVKVSFTCLSYMDRRSNIWICILAMQ
jgi:hypothetical protein